MIKFYILVTYFTHKIKFKKLLQLNECLCYNEYNQNYCDFKTLNLENFMNNQSKQLIREFMATHTFGTNADYNFEELYNLFITLEVKDIVSLLHSPDDFQDFVIENINLIKSEQPIMQYTLRIALERFKSKLVAKLEYAFNTSNVMFARTVNDLAPSKTSSILDVGSGVIPSSSIILSGLKHKVTTMDSLIILPKDALANLNVTLDKRFFGKNGLS